MNLLIYLSGTFILFLLAGYTGVPGMIRKHSHRSAEGKANLIIIVGWIIIFFLLLEDHRTGVIGAFVLSVFWFILQLRTHWMPYIFGSPEDYRNEYEYVYRNTIKILPRLTRRSVRPDAYHTFLLILLVLSIVKSLSLLRSV